MPVFDHYELVGSQTQGESIAAGPLEWRARLIMTIALVMIVGSGCEVLIVPSDELKREFLSWEFGMFLHFNMATFTDREWANGYEDPGAFAPDSLDIEQWADVAQLGGMRYGVLTVKHTGGWSLWDSDYTSHDASAFVNFRDGQGDIVRDFVETFRRRGLKVGLYYCLPGDFEGKFGNTLQEGQPALHGLPPEAQGDYVRFIKNQLAELLTRYGAIDLLWIDQSRSRYISRSAWIEIRNHIKRIQPASFVLANDSRNHPLTDIHSYEYPVYRDGEPSRGFPPVGNRHPAEVSDVMGPSWFWNSTHDKRRMKSAEEIVSMLTKAHARSANYLLNVAPDATGRIPRPAVETLRQVGMRRTVGALRHD